MKLLFKQRFFSWFDSYDIYDEGGRGVFTVEGKLGWGHVLHVLDAGGRHVGTVREKVLTLFEPKFEIFTGADEYIGCITKRFTFFKPKFDIDFNGWQVEGDFWGWDYSVVSPTGETVARHNKGAFQLDRHLFHRRCAPRERPVRAHARACYRRRKMQQQ